MKYVWLAVLLLGGWQMVWAGNGSKDSIAVEMAKSITAADLEKHLQVIASDEYEGRETGEKGQKMAAEYIAKYFEELGLKAIASEGYYQPVPLQRKQTREGTITANRQSFKYLEDFYSFSEMQLEWTTQELLFLGYGVEADGYSDFKGDIDFKGKAALILDGVPEGKQALSTAEAASWNAYKKAAVAQEKGVSVLFLVKDNFEFNVARLRRYLKRARLSLKKEEVGEADPMKLIVISEGMADQMLSKSKKTVKKLRKKVNKKGPQSFALEADLKLQVDSKTEEVRTENVLGFIEGSDLKDEVVVVTAHYDHIGKRGEDINNGADDDGSGTVTVLELAQAFKTAREAGHGPRRSMLFMTVSGEEKGLLGSEYYVEHPVLPLENTVTDLNIDMIGRIDDKHEDGNYIYLIGSDRLSSDLHEISETANKQFTQLDLDYTFNEPDDPNRFYYRSDHYNFAKKGIPVIFYFSGVHEDYHKPTDTVDKIDFEKMEKIGRLVFHTAWEVANRDERPVVDKPVE